ncbi:MAG: glycosyltransferase [Nevskia sp.]|nr:glycosyltransferase [Nevskia sp.]
MNARTDREPQAANPVATAPRDPVAAPGAPARLLFLGKRFYTNKDALSERFGRIHHLPLEWSKRLPQVRSWLVDYHSREPRSVEEGALRIDSAPALGWSCLRLLRAALRFRPEVVVASGDCYIGLLGWVLARACGATFVFDIYDKYDDFGAYRTPPGFDLFGFLRRGADRCLFASRALAASYAGEARRGPPDAAVPNGIDPAGFRPLPPERCRAELGLPAAARIAGYFGGMEADRGVADLVAAVALLRAQGLDLRLLICGKRHPDTALDHDWIDYRGVVPHAQMPLYVNACDVVAVPYRRTSFMDMGASCKVVEYLMCRRPVVSSRTPNFVGNFPRQAAELESCLFECGDVEGLARALRLQLQAPVLASVPADYNWERIAAAALDAVVDAHAARLVRSVGRVAV